MKSCLILLNVNLTPVGSLESQAAARNLSLSELFSSEGIKKRGYISVYLHAKVTDAKGTAEVWIGLPNNTAFGKLLENRKQWSSSI
uniref:Uncharacterized protein n=1 Tax=Setaria italica TaxID=4555 RepID=K3YB90_SETIT